MGSPNRRGVKATSSPHGGLGEEVLGPLGKVAHVGREGRGALGDGDAGRLDGAACRRKEACEGAEHRRLTAAVLPEERVEPCGEGEGRRFEDGARARRRCEVSVHEAHEGRSLQGAARGAGALGTWGRARFGDAPLVEANHAVEEGSEGRGVVLREQEGGFSAEGAERVQEALAGGRIEARERLIQQEDLGRRGPLLGEDGAFGLAAREGGGVAARVPREPEAGEGRPRPREPLRAGDAEVLQLEAGLLLHREAEKLVLRVLEERARDAGGLHGVAEGVEAADAKASLHFRVRGQEPREGAQKRALAAAVRAREEHRLTFGHLQRDAVEEAATVHGHGEVADVEGRAGHGRASRSGGSSSS